MTAAAAPASSPPRATPATPATPAPPAPASTPPGRGQPPLALVLLATTLVMLVPTLLIGWLAYRITAPPLQEALGGELARQARATAAAVGSLMMRLTSRPAMRPASLVA